MVVDVDSGALQIDEALLRDVGWHPDSSRTFQRPYHQLVLGPYSWIRATKPAAVDGADGDGGEQADEWMAAPLVRQYPSSLRAMKEVFEGGQCSERVPWRTSFAGGEVYELLFMVWAEGVHEGPPNAGRPARVVIAWEQTTGLLVDPLE